MTMNPEAQQLLEEIIKKNPEDLSKEEVGFLNARASYLNNEQRRIFASVLRDVTPQQEEVQPEPEVIEAAAQVQEQVQPVETGEHSADPDWHPNQ